MAKPLFLSIGFFIMGRKTGIVWFRNDLRIHDNEALVRAVERTDQVVPVYIFDPRQFGKTAFGFDKTGAFRAQFLIEAVEDLRNRLRDRGSDLLIRRGFPEEILPQLTEQYHAVWVFANKEVTDEERQVADAVEKNLFGQHTTLELFWSNTLYHLEDLPFPVKATPDIFTQFRNQVEKNASIRPPLAVPFRIQTPLMISGEIPSLNDLGIKAHSMDARTVLRFKGGETEALQRLDTYFWKKDLLSIYKETRNELIGADYSSKFSPWLAIGCISPRFIHHEIRRYEEERKKNDSTYWLIFELMWRDFFRFTAKKYGNRFFHPGGLKGQAPEIQPNPEAFERWVTGTTGIPFVDANMRELRLTGFMSNRGRQNVASFLVKDLHQDWRMGASYFESMLIDYDVCSNWGNWNYVAGVGNDPRENRYFNIQSQAERYDPKGAYVRLWCPELRDLPPHMIHQPYKFYEHDLRRLGVELGKTYPFPLAIPGQQEGVRQSS